MSDLLYVIRAVEERRPFVDEMLKQIPGAVVYYDTHGSARASYLHTCKNIIAERPAIVLEDDVILTSNFRAKVEAVVEKYPGILINFFSLSKKYTAPHFKKGREFCMTQCVYFPPGFGTRVYESFDNWPMKNTTVSAFDYLIGYAWGYSKPYLVWCPSLVQHREVKSVIDSRRSTKRQSITFVE